MLVAAHPASAVCVGDCNTSGEVTVDELITGVNIVLGSVSPDRCEAFDSSADGVVTVDEDHGGRQRPHRLSTRADSNPFAQPMSNCARPHLHRDPDRVADCARPRSDR